MGALSPWHILIILVVVAVPVVVIGAIVYAVMASRKKQPQLNGYAQQGIQAGWYPDPQNANLFRWHDGIRWTESTSPRG